MVYLMMLFLAVICLVVVLITDGLSATVFSFCCS